MSLYYFHLHECGTTTLDREGSEFLGIAQALVAATDAARDIMAHEVLAGKLCLACYIQIDDDQGVEVERVLFADAIQVSGLAQQAEHHCP